MSSPRARRPAPAGTAVTHRACALRAAAFALAALAALAGSIPLATAAPGAPGAPGAPVPGSAAAAALNGPPRVGRRQVELPAAVLERYTGYYALGNSAVINVTRAGTQLSAELTGQPAAAIYPLSAAAFVFSDRDAQIDFIPDPPAQINALVLHQGGVDQIAARIDAEQAQRIAGAVAARQQGQAPAPGSEAAVRRLLSAIAAGAPDYGGMTAEFAGEIRAQLPRLQPALGALGAVQAVQFQGAGNQGWDVYLVQHERGSSQVRIQLAADGRIAGALISTAP